MPCEVRRARRGRRGAGPRRAVPRAPRRVVGAPTNGPRLVSTMRARFGGFGALIARRLGDERVELGELQGRVEAALEADRRRRLRAHRLPAERAGDVAGEHLDAVGELEQPAERVEEPLGALVPPDREIGPGGVADEQRVAGEHEPRLVAARVVDDREAAVLRPVAGRMDDAERDGADRDLVTVAHRVVRVVDAGVGVHADGMPCSSARRPCPETWSACVCVSIVRTIASPRLVASARTGLDRERRIDDRRRCPLPRLRRGNTRSRGRRSGTGGRSRRATVAPGPAISLEVISARRRRTPTRLPAITTIPARAAAIAPQGCCAGAAVPVAGSTLRSPASERQRRRRRSAPPRTCRCRPDARSDRESGTVPTRRALEPTARPGHGRAVDGRAPAGGSSGRDDGDAGGRCRRTRDRRVRRTLVRCRRTTISVSTPSSTNGGAIVTCAAAAAGRTRAIATSGERAPHGRPRWRAITIR